MTLQLQRRAYVPASFGMELRQVRDQLWRVSSPGGRLFGYIEVDGAPSERRFSARVVQGRALRQLPLGSFHSFDDALTAFRNA